MRKICRRLGCLIRSVIRLAPRRVPANADRRTRCRRLLAYAAMLSLLGVPMAWAQDMSLPQLQDMVARGQYREALAPVEALIRMQPDNAEARFLRGVIYAQLGQIKRAIAIFRGLTEQFPNLSEPYNNLAVLHASSGDYDKAREVLLRAVELQPDYETAHENLGDIYVKLAITAYQRAHEAAPRNLRAQSKGALLSDLLNHRAERTLPIPGLGAASMRPASPAPSEHEHIAADVATAKNAPAPTAGDRLTGDNPPASLEPAPCILVGPLAGTSEDADISSWLKTRDWVISVAPHQGPASHYRVYLPPLADLAQAQARVMELRDKGLRDLMLMRTGALRNGISVGVYGHQDSVRKRVSEFSSLGYEARVQPLSGGSETPWLAIRTNVPRELLGPRIGEAFPGRDLSLKQCPQVADN